MSMSDEFDQIIKTFTSYYRVGNTKALCSLFTKDAVVIPRGENRARGQYDIAEVFKSVLDRNGHELVVAITDFQDRGDTGYAVGTWEVSSNKGNWVNLVERQVDGSLLLSRVRLTGAIDVTASQNNNIILIGPVGAGKSTQGKLVASALNKPSLSLDNIAEDYYEESGFGSTKFERARKEKGLLAAYRLWWPSLAYAATQVVNEHTDCVIDFGAGHSHYEDKNMFEDVKQALTGYKNIILLLPSADLDRSVSLLRQRSVEERNTDWIHDGYDFIEHWVKDDSNHELATSTIFTDGKTPAETCEEILTVLEN